jgi:hypothetical protein
VDLRREEAEELGYPHGAVTKEIGHRRAFAPLTNEVADRHGRDRSPIGIDAYEVIEPKRCAEAELHAENILHKFVVCRLVSTGVEQNKVAVLVVGWEEVPSEPTIEPETVTATKPTIALLGHRRISDPRQAPCQAAHPQDWELVSAPHPVVKIDFRFGPDFSHVREAGHHRAAVR